VSDFRQQLLGTWAVVRAELGGEAMPPEAAAQIEIEFDADGDKCGSAGGAYRVRFAGEVSDAGRFTLLAGKNHIPEDAKPATLPHRRITLHGEIGTNAGRTLPGILQLKGERLRICLALEGDPPPTEFSSSNTDCANDTPHYLVTYRRKTLRREH